MNREALSAIPEHMHEAVIDWVERGEPHPSQLGSFFRAVLTNDLAGAVSRADHMNGVCLREWALLLYNDIPRACWGSEEKLIAWYDAAHTTHVIDAEFPEVGEEVG